MSGPGDTGHRMEESKGGRRGTVSPGWGRPADSPDVFCLDSAFSLAWWKMSGCSGTTRPCVPFDADQMHAGPARLQIGNIPGPTSVTSAVTSASEWIRPAGRARLYPREQRRQALVQTHTRRIYGAQSRFGYLRLG